MTQRVVTPRAKAARTGAAHVVERAPQVRALSSAVRQEIVDTLQALGTASIAQLAAQLARPADGLYYHVRALIKAGLLRQAGQRAGRTRHEALFETAAPKQGLRLRYTPQSPAATKALHKLIGAMLRTSAKDFRLALTDTNVVVEGPKRDVWAARRKTWLNTREHAELVGMLNRLQQFLAQRRSPQGRRLIALTYVLSPSVHGRGAGVVK